MQQSRTAHATKEHSEVGEDLFSAVARCVSILADSSIASKTLSEGNTVKPAANKGQDGSTTKTSTHSHGWPRAQAAVSIQLQGRRLVADYTNFGAEAVAKPWGPAASEPSTVSCSGPEDYCTNAP
jgi:hypothetical protein